MSDCVVMEVSLKALEHVKDINNVLDSMEADMDNEIVKAIQTSVGDLQSRKGLLAFLKVYDAPVIYLNLSLGGE